MRSSSMPLWRPRESRGTCSRLRIASRRRQAPGVALPGAGALPDGVGLAGLVVVATIFRFRVSREVIGSRSDAAISALFGFFLLTVAITLAMYSRIASCVSRSAARTSAGTGAGPFALSVTPSAFP